MTHEEFWDALRATQAARQGSRRPGFLLWTPDEVLACLQSWAAEEGRIPGSSDLGPAWLLPGYTTIVRVYGSLEAAWAALGWAYRPYGERPSGSQGRVPNRACLSCDVPFYTAERFVRVCERCKRNEEWQATGEWMCGIAVLEGGDASIEAWEDVP